MTSIIKVDQIQNATGTNTLNLSTGNSSLAGSLDLSNGGVYLGGTGSANRLEDYEEGTFTLTSANVSAGPSGSNFVGLTGVYKKVNDVVTCFVSFSFSDAGTNFALDHRWSVSSLPFTPALSDIYGVGTWWSYDSVGGGRNAFGQIGITSGNYVYFYVTHVDGTVSYTRNIKGVFTYLV